MLRHLFTWRVLASVILLAILGLASCTALGLVVPGSQPVSVTGADAASSTRSEGVAAAKAGSATPSDSGRMTLATPRTGDRMATIKLDRLPPEARATLDLIARRGPFPYSQDGAVFQNREGLLPGQAGGYYHEYTVETPGSPDRGARRVIQGGPGEFYYTSDHYASFARIVP